MRRGEGNVIECSPLSGGGVGILQEHASKFSVITYCVRPAVLGEPRPAADRVASAPTLRGAQVELDRFLAESCDLGDLERLSASRTAVVRFHPRCRWNGRTVVLLKDDLDVGAYAVIPEDTCPCGRHLRALILRGGDLDL